MKDIRPEQLKCRVMQAPVSGSLAAKAIAAATRVYEVVVQTPTVPDKWLSRQSGSEAMLKLENEQVRLVLDAASWSIELLDSSDVLR